MYKIILDREAANFLRKSDRFIQERISSNLEKLKSNPHKGIPLSGNLAGLWKLRVGDYRIIYKIKNQELIILIVKIGHRRNVYE